MRIRLGVLLVIAATVAASFGAGPALSQTAGPTSNPIVIENQQPGTDQWQIPTTGYQQSDDTNNQIKGYASATSVNKGGSLGISVTVNPSQSFTISFYRMGYYGGLGGRLLLTTGSIAGVRQPACPVIDTSTNLMACNWSPSYTLSVPTTW